MPQDTSIITQQQKLSAQSAVRSDQVAGVGFLYWMSNAGEIIAPWWSKSRDQQLRTKSKESDHFLGAVWTMSAKMTSVPFKVEPRDNSVKAHHKQADLFNALLEEGVQFGGGWERLWTPVLMDLWTQDNGAFIEVIGAGKPDKAIKGPVVGLAHLDSFQCSRTSNPEYPVIYEDKDGKRYRFHYTRVIEVSQLPSPAAEMNGVGHSWLTRCIDVAQNLIDIAVYKEEKLGSRPIRGIMKYRGGDANDIIGALAQAEEGMDNQSLRRFAKMAVIGLTDPAADLEMMDLASLPDGFDEDTSTRLGMYTMALAGGFPPRWLWPATNTGATQADAMYSHIAGTGGGASWHLNMMRRVLGGSERGDKHLLGKVLPPHLKLTFDYQDDEQDRAQSDIRSTRSKTRETDISAGVTNVQVSREQAVSDGDLTEAQFKQLELEEGRLPNGDDVLTLFVNADDFYIEMLDLGVDEPLLIDANDPLDMMIELETAAMDIQDIIANASATGTREKAKQALVALGKLKEMYQKLVVEEIASEMVAEGEQGQAPPQPGGGEEEQAEGEQPEGEEAQEGEEEQPESEKQLAILPPLLPFWPMSSREKQLTKQFNFGAGVGEIISGQLARGEGGKFANAAEMEAKKNEVLQRLLGRLKARRAGKGKKKGGGSSAEAKREANREKVAEELAGRGLPANTMDALVGMRGGEEPDEETLAAMEEQGLAQRNPDGTVNMTPEGRAVLTAANTGDVDKATAALQAVKDKRAKAKKAAAKKRGAAGAKPKKTPEERAAEREQAKAEVKTEAFDTLSESADIDRGDLDTLDVFKDGGGIEPEAAQRLAADGLVEFGTDGTPRMTGAGRSMLSAAGRGDAQRASEAASKARERVEKTRERADLIDEQIDDAMTDADDKVAKLEDRMDRPGSSEDSNARIMAQIEEIRASVEERRAKLQERADELRAKIGESPGGEGELKSVPFELKDLGSFRRGIRAAIRGLWSGAINEFDFMDAMGATIERRLREAWLAGAAECGLQPDELSDEETQAMRTLIANQYAYLPGFAAEVANESKTEGGKLGPLMDRGELWVGRYKEAVERGKAMACADRKLRWTLGEAEHCSSCVKLSGKVKRASFWATSGILPRVAGAPYLECHGYKCDCSLQPTDDKMTPGRMPGLP